LITCCCFSKEGNFTLSALEKEGIREYKFRFRHFPLRLGCREDEAPVELLEGFGRSLTLPEMGSFNLF